MKNLFIVFIGMALATVLQAQNFKKDIAAAKTSFSAGKLEEAHFTLQQTLQELDMTIGKEVLKALPLKLDTLKVNAKDDNVGANTSFIGATIHRSYGMGAKRTEVEIINNSPMLGTLNAFLTNPLLANMGNDGNTKVLKIQGYKSRLTKENNSDMNTTDYRLEIPLSNALISFNVKNSSEAETIAMANAIPIDQIAKLIE